MRRVTIREGESFDSLLRRFRKEVTKSRILSDVKKKRFFVSKSEERRRAQRKAVSRERKRMRKERGRYGS
jgi:small subunit ribosomal protein S21